MTSAVEAILAAATALSLAECAEVVRGVQAHMVAVEGGLPVRADHKPRPLTNKERSLLKRMKKSGASPAELDAAKAAWRATGDTKSDTAAPRNDTRRDTKNDTPRHESDTAGDTKRGGFVAPVVALVIAPSSSDQVDLTESSPSLSAEKLRKTAEVVASSDTKPVTRNATKRRAPRDTKSDTETAWVAAYSDGMEARHLVPQRVGAGLRREVAGQLDRQATLEGTLVGSVLVRVMDGFWRNEKARAAGYPPSWLKNVAQWLQAPAAAWPARNSSARPVGDFSDVAASRPADLFTNAGGTK